MSLPKDEMVELLEVMKGVGEFRNVPVTWNVGRKGPRMVVQRSDVRIKVSVNCKGLRMGELQELVNRALAAASDIHRELTRASIIASEPIPSMGNSVARYVPKDWTQEEIEHMLEGARIKVKELEMKLGRMIEENKIEDVVN
jgi:hypothetical protein